MTADDTSQRVEFSYMLVVLNAVTVIVRLDQVVPLVFEIVADSAAAVVFGGEQHQHCREYSMMRCIRCPYVEHSALIVVFAIEVAVVAVVVVVVGELRRVQVENLHES